MFRSIGQIITVVAVAGAFAMAAAAPGSWEMRVCAEPFGYPMSGREVPGAANLIADILADELGAEATFEWTHLDAASVGLTLMAGKCDLIIGMTEGAAGAINTVPIARIPFVFVSLPGQQPDISSLDDPRLHDLAIGTYMSGLPSIALHNRGITSNVREYPFEASPGGPDHEVRILDAVISGEVDIGIIYGPPAAGRMMETGTELNIVPVSPEIEFAPSMLQFFRTLTIGVRPGDVALRDLLEVAVARRWDDIQQVYADLRIPTLHQARPAGIPEVPAGLTRVALIAPVATGAAIEHELLGESARFGGMLAEYFIGRTAAGRSVPFQLLLASAPDDASALRAADRLLATAAPAALIGGFNEEQALQIAQATDEAGAVFFSIAMQSDSFRQATCDLSTFHVEASQSQYAAALGGWYGSQGLDSWYVIHEDTPAGHALMGAVARQLEAAGSRVTGSAAVAPRQFAYMNQIREAAELHPDVVLLLTSDVEQKLFLSQAASSGLDAVITGLTGPEGQRRDSLFQLAQAAPVAGLAARALLWEASLPGELAADINGSYTPRAGEPMPAAGWAAFAAVMMAFEGASAGVTDLGTWLADETTTFDLGKDEVWFDGRQLQQPLYLVAGQEGAGWSRIAGDQVAIARLEGTAFPDLPPLCD